MLKLEGDIANPLRFVTRCFDMSQTISGARAAHVSLWGGLDEVGRAQVNQRMETIHGAGQQQEPIEVISGVSH